MLVVSLVISLSIRGGGLACKTRSGGGRQETTFTRYQAKMSGSWATVAAAAAAAAVPFFFCIAVLFGANPIQ